MKKKISTDTKSTQTEKYDENEEIIYGFTRRDLENLGIKIITYRKQYYIDNRAYIINKSSLKYHESKLNKEPVITAIDRFINNM